MLRVTTVWTGFIGSPGYTNHYFEEATIAEPGAYDACRAVRQFFLAAAPLMPSTVHLDVQHTVAQIDEHNGAQTGEIADIAPGSTMLGGDGNNYSAPSGASINWGTATFVGGHRITGRTFIVPLGRGAYGPDGELLPASLTTLRTAANIIATPLIPLVSRMVVWHRPKYVVPKTTPPTIAVPGSYGIVTTYNVKAKSAVLTSRRD